MYPPDDLRPVLRPPQFGLRTLLIGVAICGALCALTQWLPPVVVIGVAFLALSIGAHIAGNSLGTQLRELGSQSPPELQAARRKEPPVADEVFAPATRLSQRQSLGWPLLAATLAGFVAGAIGGGWWTVVSAVGDVTELSIAVGIVAFSILGGIGSFLAAGLIQVLGGAFRQALRGAAPAPPHRPGVKTASHG